MINTQNINIQNWHSLLQDLNPQKDTPTDKVFCLVKKDKETFYQVFNLKDWETVCQDPLQTASYTKLRLREIIAISNKLMSEKSRAPISFNPFFAIFMPIAAWKKAYHINILLFRIPEIINSKELHSFAKFHHDVAGQQVSKEILDGLQKIEEESQQLREIFTHLKIMSQRSDEKRDQKIQTIWARCVFWVCSSLFGDETSKIKHKLEVELGEKGQVLDIGAQMIRALIIQFANAILQNKGQATFSNDQGLAFFSNGKIARGWAHREGYDPSPMTRLSTVLESIENAKQVLDDDDSDVVENVV
jgi:hypothetical protein